MLITINYNIFPSDELFTFGSSVSSFVNGKVTSIPALATRSNALINALSNYQKALMRVLKSPYTQMLNEADAVLDKSFIALRTYFDAASLRPLESWKQSAQQLLEVTERFGRTSNRLGYKAQIAAQSNFEKELRENFAAQLTAINADEWFSEFSNYLSAFIELYNKSNEEAPAAEPTLKETRPELIGALRKLFRRIELMEEDESSEAIEQLVNSLNELSTRSISTVKAAATRIQHSKDEEAVD